MLIKSKYAQNFECPLRDRECAGDSCPAWRWGEDSPEPRNIIHIEARATSEPKERPKGVPKSYKFYAANHDCDAFWGESDAAAELRRRGYCGLAGRPEFEE